MLTNGVWGLFMLVDVYLIGLLTDDVTLVADYKVAHVFPGAMTILSSTIGIFVTPYFVKNEKNKAWIKQKYKLLSRVTMVLIGGLILILIIFSRVLIKFVYGDTYLNICPIMVMLFISAFFNAGIRFTVANVLAAVGIIKHNLRVSVIGLVLAVILDIVLIRPLGLYGVAITNIIVYAYMGIDLSICFHRYYGSKDT